MSVCLPWMSRIYWPTHKESLFTSGNADNQGICGLHSHPPPGEVVEGTHIWKDKRHWVEL